MSTRKSRRYLCERNRCRKQELNFGQRQYNEPATEMANVRMSYLGTNPHGDIHQIYLKDQRWYIVNADPQVIVKAFKQPYQVLPRWFVIAF